jgi:hypothetical protein
MTAGIRNRGKKYRQFLGNGTVNMFPRKQTRYPLLSTGRINMFPGKRIQHNNALGSGVYCAVRVALYENTAVNRQS